MISFNILGNLLGISQNVCGFDENEKAKEQEMGNLCRNPCRAGTALVQPQEIPLPGPPSGSGEWQQFMCWTVPYSLMVVTYGERKESSREKEKW